MGAGSAATGRANKNRTRACPAVTLDCRASIKRNLYALLDGTALRSAKRTRGRVGPSRANG